jgi:hypothetical protein
MVRVGRAAMIQIKPRHSADRDARQSAWASGSNQSSPLDAPEARRSTAGHAAWLIGAVLLGFLLSFVFAGMLSVPRPWFVLAHTVTSGLFLAGYAAWAGLGIKRLFLRHPRLGLTAGVIAAAVAVQFVLSGPGSPRPEGMELVWAVLWTGVVYGVVDALLLTVMPIFAVWSIGFEVGWSSSWPGRIATGFLALLASVLVTAAYHVGFPEFQGPQLVQPLIGNTLFSLAYLLTASPMAPILAHVAMHIAAVVHAHGTSIPLPPHY